MLILEWFKSYGRERGIRGEGTMETLSPKRHADMNTLNEHGMADALHWLRTCVESPDQPLCSVVNAAEQGFRGRRADARADGGEYTRDYGLARPIYEHAFIHYVATIAENQVRYGTKATS